MKYCDYHGGGQEDNILEFKSPFELGEYLREKLWQFNVPVTFENLRAKKYTKIGDPRRGWKELWIVSIEGYGVAGWADSWFEENK